MRISRSTKLWLLALCAAPAAQALTIDLAPLARLQISHDSNVFRAAQQPAPGTAGKVGDTITRQGLGTSLKLTQSLQSLELRGELDKYQYSEQKQLNHTRYKTGATARLAVGSTLQLTLDLGRERRLENFAYRDDNAKGFLTQSTASANLQYAISPRYALTLSNDYLARQATLADSKDFDVTERSTELGLRYNHVGLSQLDAVLRHVSGEFPNRVSTVGDGREKAYNQDSLLLRGAYIPSGISRLTATLGYTNRSHSDRSVADFSGVVGRIGLARQLSGRTELRVDAYRDLYYVQEVGANYVENLGLSVGADYRYSPKLTFATVAERVASSYQGGAGNGLDTGRNDTLFTLRTGLEYQPFYRFYISPDYRLEVRHSSRANQAYSDHQFNLQLAYRYGLSSPYNIQYNPQ